MSGIVGTIRRRFCLFGDTVNMASRTETSCPAGCIQLTSAAQQLVDLEERGLVELKGAPAPVLMFLARAGYRTQVSTDW